MPEELEKKDDNKPKNEEEQKKGIAQAYGIKLSDIEHVKIDNGKEFFKFYNEKTRQVKMIENLDHNNGISKQFESIQQELSFTQSSDERENANAIYDHNSKHKNIELNLIPIKELKGNKYKYLRRIKSLSTIDRKKVMALMQNAKRVGLEYINIENAIGIDSNNNVLDVVYDYGKNRAVIKNATVLNYQDKKNYDDDDDLSLEVSVEEFDKAVSNIPVGENGISIPDTDVIEINDEFITGKEIKECYNMPEAINQLEPSRKRRFMINGIIAALTRRMGKNNSLNKDKVKLLANTNNTNKGAAA